MSYEVWGEPDDGPELPEGWLNEDDAQELRDRITELEAKLASTPAPVAMVEGSPAHAMRGLWKLHEYYVGGKPVSPEEYIAWQAAIIGSITKAKLPDAKYYGGSAEEGEQHEVKCAYVDGWNDCRGSILAAPLLQPAPVAISEEQIRTIEHAAAKLENIGHIFAGDKESRRLAGELKSLLASIGNLS